MFLYITINLNNLGGTPITTMADWVLMVPVYVVLIDVSLLLFYDVHSLVLDVQKFSLVLVPVQIHYYEYINTIFLTCISRSLRLSFRSF